MAVIFKSGLRSATGRSSRVERAPILYDRYARGGRAVTPSETRRHREPRVDRRADADVVVAIDGRPVLLVEHVFDVELNACFAAGQRVVKRRVGARKRGQFYGIGEG